MLCLCNLTLDAYYTDTWEKFFSENNAPIALLAADVSLDPVTGRVYGCLYKDDGSGFVFGYADYFIGFHDISDADMSTLFIDNFRISGPVSVAAPAPVDDLEVTPDASGALSAEIRYTASGKNMVGEDIDELERIELSRDGVVIDVVENPVQGEEYSFIDELEAAGIYTYEVTANNMDGAGEPFGKSVYVGINRPAAVAAVRATENGDAGEVTVSWDQVVKDADGLDINPAIVTYDLFEHENGAKVNRTS